MDESKLVETAVLYEGKWLRLLGKDYVLEGGHHEIWECAERTTRQGDVDIAEVIA
jgi:hypothetical protein